MSRPSPDEYRRILVQGLRDGGWDTEAYLEILGQKQRAEIARQPRTRMSTQQRNQSYMKRYGRERTDKVDYYAAHGHPCKKSK